MRQFSLLTVFLLVLSLFVFGCQQKKSSTEKSTAEPKAESQAATPPAATLPPASGMQKTPPMHPTVSHNTPTTIKVPTEVSETWESAIVKIENKKDGSSTSQTIPLHSDYSIPGTSLTLKVGDFLPQFTMDGGVITSLSNEPKNPALHVAVLDQNKKIFEGWLFQRFPTMHPFTDDRVAITLVGSNAKKTAQQKGADVAKEKTDTDTK